MPCEENEKLVSIDWKFVGRDYMGFFPDNYPELKFLFSQEWQDLCDKVANELPENLFEEFSPWLANYGYELWNLDDNSDSYNLFIVASKDTKKFVKQWVSEPIWEDGDVYFTPCRLGAEAAKAVKKPFFPKITKQTKRQNLIEATDYHLEYGGISEREERQFQLIEYEDGEVFKGIADIDKFPFEIIEADDFYEKINQDYELYPLYTRGENHYWEITEPKSKSKKQKRNKKIIRVKSYENGEYEEVIGIVFPSSAYLYRAVFGKNIFILYTPAHLGNAPKPDSILYRIQGLECQTICEIKGEYSNILELNDNEVLVVNNQTENTNVQLITSVQLIDCETKLVKIIKSDYSLEDTFIINNDELGFIHTMKTPHPELDYLNQGTGYLGRLNIRNGKVSLAHLDGLYHEYKFDPTVLRNQPVQKINVKSFEGFISAQKGHDEWMVLNYISNSSGKHDLAWLWNKANDEIVKIRNTDIPQIEPIISYNHALKKYVADSSCRIDLLKDFKEIYENADKIKLIWLDSI